MLLRMISDEPRDGNNSWHAAKKIVCRLTKLAADII